jgi:DNA repair ATPase RecN
VPFRGRFFFFISLISLLIFIFFLCFYYFECSISNFNLAKESNNQSSDDKKKLSNFNEIKKVIGKIKETLQEEISNIDITDPLGKKFKQKPKTEKQITEGIWLAKIYNNIRGIDLAGQLHEINNSHEIYNKCINYLL